MTENIGLGEQALGYKICLLAQAQGIARTFKAELEAKRLAWMEEQRLLIETVALSVKAVTDLEQEIRAQAVGIYNADPQKQKNLGYGVKIRVSQVLLYDPQTALDWARENAKVALQLDKRVFEGIAKSQALDFVRVLEEPQATIATDLDKALKEEAK